MSQLNRWTALVKRELIEYRRFVLFAPFILAAVVCIGVLLSALVNNSIQVDGMTLDRNNLQLMSAWLSKEMQKQSNSIELMHQAWSLGLFGLFHAFCAIVCFNYALGSLFDERKDRSTLWWRSLPVHDWETVLSKVTMIALVIPLICLAALLICELFVWLVMAGLAKYYGLDATALVLTGANLPKIFAWQLASQMLTSLWILPVYAWCLFCSAYSKQRPILLALLVPSMIWLVMLLVKPQKVIQLLTNQEISLDVVGMYFSRAKDAFVPLGVVSKDEGSILNFAALASKAFSTPMVVGLVIAGALLAATIWVRRYREDAAQ